MPLPISERVAPDAYRLAIGIAVAGGLWFLFATFEGVLAYRGALPDAQLLIGAVSAVTAICAAVGCLAVLRGRWFWAAFTFFVSAASPTGFAYIVNVVPIVLAVLCVTIGLRLRRPPS